MRTELTAIFSGEGRKYVEIFVKLLKAIILVNTLGNTSENIYKSLKKNTL